MLVLHPCIIELLFVSANLRAISTLFVGVICGSNKDAVISLIRSSVYQADLDACSSLYSKCQGRPWKQSTLPHPGWRWWYSYTGGRRIALFGAQKSIDSFMQRQVEVCLQFKWRQSFICSKNPRQQGRLLSPVRSLLMECCGAKEVPERLTRSGTDTHAAGFNSRCDKCISTWSLVQVVAIFCWQALILHALNWLKLWDLSSASCR